MLKKIKNFTLKQIKLYQNISRNMGHTIVMIGQTATYVGIYKNQKLIDSLTIDGLEYNLNDYNSFFNKYKKYHLSLILDTADVAMQSADIPLAQGISNKNPINKFIEQNFSKDAIVESRLYETTFEITETLQIVFASIVPNHWYSKVIEHFVTNYPKFHGIYFLNIATPDLNNDLLHIANVDDSNEFKILATITKSCGIRVIATQDRNILHSRRVEYSLDKSHSYIAGMLEQEITDCLISARRTMEDSQAKPMLILLLSKEMRSVMQNSKFQNMSKVVSLDAQDNMNEEFSDAVILNSASKILKEEGATSKSLKSFRTLKFYNNAIINPILILISALMIFCGFNLLRSQKLLWSIKDIDTQSYQASEEYRKIKSNYPNVSNIDQILDFQAATSALKKQQILPFDVINAFLDKASKNFIITKIDWALDESQESFINDEDSHKQNLLRIKISAKYSSSSSSDESTLTSLDSEISELQRILLKCEISYIRDFSTANNALHYGSATIMPIEINIICNKDSR